jgi:hypothetical protein
VLVGAILGAPIFVLLSVTIFASYGIGTTPVILLVRGYEQLTVFRLAAIPLFTLADSCSRKADRPSACCASSAFSAERRAASRSRPRYVAFSRCSPAVLA